MLAIKALSVFNTGIAWNSKLPSYLTDMDFHKEDSNQIARVTVEALKSARSPFERQAYFISFPEVESEPYDIRFHERSANNCDELEAQHVPVSGHLSV
jgi:hypothetical protein